MDKQRSKMVEGVVAIAAIAVGGIANYMLADRLGEAKLAAWWITIATMVVLCICIGRSITDRWDGVLIDSRNRISLSRMQMLAWTLLVLSALITAAASNLAVPGNADALAIAIPDELLVAMGIAATSMAATPALLTLKGSDPATGQTMAATNPDPCMASWLEMFRGDNAGDSELPDLSKIQQFLITLALVGGYGVLIGNLFRDMTAGSTFVTFPPLDPKVIWLLGISHAGYLGYKAASQPGNGGSSSPPAQ